MSNLVTAALELAKKGWPVFPADPGTKGPLTKHGFQDASRDPAVISDWWARWPEAMIAVPTGEPSGIVVLDVDRDAAKGIDGEASLSMLLAELGISLPMTLSQRTPRGGRHIVFAYPRGTTIRNSPESSALGSMSVGAAGTSSSPPR